MFITFLTVLATIWVVVYVIGTSQTLIEFWNMTPVQRITARITFDSLGLSVFVVCVAWLIARIIG